MQDSGRDAGFRERCRIPGEMQDSGRDAGFRERCRIIDPALK
jgi:hypothetical protein